MNKIITWVIGVVAILALVISIGNAVGGNQSVSLGGTTNYDTLGLTGLKVGSGCNDSYGSCTGTSIAQLNAGTCYILPYATTIAATSSAQVDCQGTAAIGTTNTTLASALTGVAFGDKVQVTLSTTTAGSTVNGLVLGGATASTTSGYITLKISNLTGTTYTWPVTGNASGTASFITIR
jgi:hypothetical protein